MGFKTKELIFIALMTALLFVANFVIGAWIVSATGIPTSSGFVTGITNLFILTFVALTVRKFGSVTLLYFVYSIIAIPTNLAGGPPGFIWKVPMLTLAAIPFDFSLWIARYRKIGFIIALPIFIVFGLVIYMGVFYLVGFPELDKFLKAVPLLVASLIVLGYIGMWLGFVVYNKMKDKRVLRQIIA